VDCLLGYEWPGNVRELQNVIRRAALVAAGGTIEPDHLALRGAPQRATPLGSRPTAPDPRAGTSAIDEHRDGEAPRGRTLPPLDDVVRRHIERALSLTGGKVYGSDGAAALLGLKPSTLQSRMQKLGIERVSAGRVGTNRERTSRARTDRAGTKRARR
jgi:transcriptional regulator with GAF, ATPase, and Fis domain